MRVVVIGGGAADTGCQLTSILADFGCEVTLVEYAARIVPRADVDVSVALENAFRRRGIKVITSAAVHKIEALGPGMRVLYRAGDEEGKVDVDATFFAVGWPGNADRREDSLSDRRTDPCIREHDPHDLEHRCRYGTHRRACFLDHGQGRCRHVPDQVWR